MDIAGIQKNCPVLLFSVLVRFFHWHGVSPKLLMIMFNTIISNPAGFDITGLWRVRRFEVNNHAEWKPLMEYGYNLLWEFNDNGTMTEYATGVEKNKTHYVWESVGRELIVEHPDSNYAGHGLSDNIGFGYTCGTALASENAGEFQLASGTTGYMGSAALGLNMEEFVDVPVGDAYRVELVSRDEIIIYDLENVTSEPDDYSFRYILSRMGHVN